MVMSRFRRRRSFRRRRPFVRRRKFKRSFRSRRNGNGLPSESLQFKRPRRFSRRFKKRATLAITNNYTNQPFATRLTDFDNLWTAQSITSFNTQSVIYASGTLGPDHPYRFLYKQFRIKKIVTYLRIVNAPTSVAMTLSEDSSAASALPIQYCPVHWELFARASNQNDAMVADELRLANNKISITNDGRQRKFVVRPMVNYALQVVKGDTQAPVSTNVEYYKPAGWVNMDDTTKYQYKCVDIMNHSFIDMTGTPTLEFNQTLACFLEVNVTTVFEFRWRKSKNIVNDPSGAKNPVPAGTSYLAAPDNVGVGLILNPVTDPGGA